MNRRYYFLCFFIAILNSCSVSESTAQDIESKCSGMTFEEIKTKNDISSECKSAIAALLPSPQNNITNRIFLLGVQQQASSSTIYLAGSDFFGTAFSKADFSEATFTAITGSVETVLAKTEVSVASAAETAGTFGSVSFVSDYSGSMSEQDLNDNSEINLDINSVLPAGIEREAYLFSESVTNQLAFSTDSASIKAALAVQKDYKRTSTALFDALQTGAKSLASRSTYAKLMVGTTDGLENSSKTATKDTTLSAIKEGKLFVLMIGSLFADVDLLKELAGSRGAFIYAKSILDAKATVKKFSAALSNAVAVQLPAAQKDAEKLKVTVGSVSATLDLK